MGKYLFNLAKKVAIWSDNKFTVEAESEEEARKIAAQFLNPDKDLSTTEDYRVDFIESEFQFNTEQDMTEDQNGGLSTKQLTFLG